jgi:hypothetical protein
VQIAKYVAPNEAPEAAADGVLAAAVFVDASGGLNVAEIDRQIEWYKQQKLVAPGVQSAAFVDTQFLQ